MPNLPKETASILDNVREPGALADLIASNFPEEHASIAVRQQILEAFDVETRVELVLGMVERQLEVLKVKSQISNIVQEEMSRSQRDYVLRQQMRSIREELGEAADDDEIEQLRERIARAELSPEAEKAARKQLVAAERHAAAIGRVPGHAHLRGVARRPALGAHARPIASTCATCGAASTRITTASSG